jgi:hypothetical protein
MRPLRIGVAVGVALAAGAWGAPARSGSQDFDRDNFAHSTDIDNRWLPLEPGTQWIYTGSNLQGKRRVHHRLISTVTDLSKLIDGVRTLVVWERDYSEGRLVEAELAFFAQDDDGNVWQLGEYPEEYERGRLVDAPAWIHGVHRARAGISMKARPRLGTPSYAQGFAPEVDWFDRAKVYRMGVRTCVPAGCYRNVLVTDEFSRNDRGAHQLKYYAPGVGNVRVGWRGKDSDQETLVLVKLRHLRPGGLAKARRESLKLEQRAYVIRRAVYGQTPPAERLTSQG